MHNSLLGREEVVRSKRGLPLIVVIFRGVP
jgi:hypothetical protein